MNVQRRFTTLAAAVMAFSAGLASQDTHAAPVTIPDIPLIVSIDSVPNVWFQVDDSGSIDVSVLASRHFTSCAYNPMLQCTDTTIPTEGAMRLFTGQWNNNNSRPVIRTMTDFWYTGASVKGHSCTTGTYNFLSRCIDDYGKDSGRRSQNSSTRDFDIDRDWRIRSSDLNVLFFNPENNYEPWRTFDNSFPDADFTAARYWPVDDDGQSPNGYDVRVNLGSASDSFFDSEQEAFHYHYWIDDKGFDGPLPLARDPSKGNNPNIIDGGNGVVDQWDSYIKVTVSNGSVSCEKISHDPKQYSWPNNLEGINPSSGPASTAECDLATQGQSDAELRQNIANWFQYYAKRAHVERAAIGNVVVEVPDIRYGIGQINNNSDQLAIPAFEITDYEAHATQVLNTLYGADRRNVGTPLRSGLRWVGQMYEGTQSGFTSPILNSCQKNFTLLFSDGYWQQNYSGSNPGSDVDGDGKVIRSSSITLADVAAYYYRNDLRPDLDDGVPTDNFDTAPWQHMVTYTIAFGLAGALTEDAGDLEGWPFPEPVDNGPWYPGNDTNTDRADDMWHAAWNGRGRFFNAQRPEELFNDVSATLNDISARIGGAASAAANSGSISSTSRIFQAKFDSADWHGELAAFPVNDDGTLGSSAAWEANTKLNAKQNNELLDRDVFTWRTDSPAKGTAFAWGSLNGTQQGHLNRDSNGDLDGAGQARLRYILGDDSEEEAQSGDFRNRENKLGDIVNSDPMYVGFPPFFYPFDDYQGYFTDNSSRPGVIYVGANDGMLHAFLESTGEELFAYIPNEVFPKLTKLTDPDYEHEFYVDGAPGYGDAFFDGDWHSVVAGGLRSGGQAVYALDVTDPLSFSASDVLWEFTDEDDADLGYVWGEPQIKRMQNGRWAVIVGNGLNNSEDDGAMGSGQASIFIIYLDASGGGFTIDSDYKKFTVPGGSQGTPNGMFTPAAADLNGDSKVDYIYAGDLLGRMWKLDVTSESDSGWELDFSGQPLFNAGADSPITDRPAIAAHPEGRGYGQLVLFGTGKYIEVSDNTTVGQETQAIYALWDVDKDYASDKSLSASGLYGYDLADLQGNSFDQQGNLRVIDGGVKADWLDADNKPNTKGWYIQFPIAGERMVRRPVLRDNLVFFVSMTPDSDPCAAGGTGFISVLDISTGLAPTFPVFDIDNDQDVTNDDDTLEPSGGDPDDPSDNLVPVGIGSSSIPNLPALIYDDRPGFAGANGPAFPMEMNDLRGCDSGSARAYTFTTGSNGSITAIETATEALSCGRQNWRGER